MTGGVLTVYTLYGHPRDWPDWYVLRPDRIGGADSGPAAICCVADGPWPLRQGMLELGLARLERSPADDPVIVEVWV